MADYQCPACYEIMGSSPRYAPVALKCGHIICITCLPKTVKRGQVNHTCSICRKDCASEDVIRIYLPTPVPALTLPPSTSSSSNRSSHQTLSKEQTGRAQQIIDAVSLVGVESREPDLQRIVTSGEQWYLSVGEQSGHSKDVLDALVESLQDLRQKLVYATRLDSLKQRLNQFKLEIDMQKNATMNAEQRLRQSEMDLARATRDVVRWEKQTRRAEALVAQWEQQANSIEDRRYTESIRAEGATNILRSQISVLQKEVQEQTRRKMGYKKKYYAMKQQTKPVARCSKCREASEDESLEIMSSTSTADEAEVSAAFSVPTLPGGGFSSFIDTAGRISPPNSQGESDDDSRTIIYGPPTPQPTQQSKKRKLSDASVASTSSVLSTLPPLTPEEQSAKESVLDSQFSKRYKAARQEGVKEGWVPPDWKAKAVLRDRIKEARRSAKRRRDEPEKESGTGSRMAAQASLSTKSGQNGARLMRSSRA